MDMEEDIKLRRSGMPQRPRISEDSLHCKRHHSLSSSGSWLLASPPPPPHNTSNRIAAPSEQNAAVVRLSSRSHCRRCVLVIADQKSR